MKLTNYIHLSAFLFFQFTVMTGIAFASNINPNAVYVDKDNPAASDSNTGSVNSPWKSLQYGLNQLAPGTHLYVRKSITPYFGPYRVRGANMGGFTINVNGTASAPIIIEGYPGERPVIDQQRALSNTLTTGQPDSPAATKALAGFYIHAGDYLTIKNFEITQTSASGVMFNPGPITPSKYITIENNYIHHLYADAVYGKDNLGGIRIDSTNFCLIRNNVIHDTYSPKTIGNPYTSEIYAFHSGIHGYRPGNCIIENNLIYNVGKGVYQKTASFEKKDSNEVRKNIFYNIGDTAYMVGVQGVGVVAAFNAKFHDNLVYNSKGAVRVKVYETSTQSTGMEIYNNTFYKVDNGITVRGMINVKVYNNIFDTVGGITFALEGPTGYGNVNGVSLFNNNLYYAGAQIWALDRYGVNAQYLRSLSAWQAASSNTSTDSLPASKDTNAVVGLIPQYIGATNNFHLKATSPAKRAGINGEDIGAYGNVAVIGPSKIPKPPTNVTAQ